MVYSLLYASRCTMAPDETDSGVEDIVRVSRTRNREADVTGCLILAGGRFAQVLEGDEAEVEAIMHSILRDARHDEVVILERGLRPKRRFSGWALGYAGPSSFIEKAIARPMLLGPTEAPRAVGDLLHTMSELRLREDLRTL